MKVVIYFIGMKEIINGNFISCENKGNIRLKFNLVFYCKVFSILNWLGV